jgi:flagellar FliL protein
LKEESETMADPEINDMEEEKEDQVEKKGLPIKIILPVVLVLILGGGGFFFLRSGPKAKTPEQTMELAALPEAEKNEVGDIGPIYSLDTFIVNLIDPYGKKYLKVRMDLEMDQEKLKQEVDRRMPQFKDTILTLLSSKTFEDINTFEGKIQLRSEIMQMLNQFLKTGSITNIYFIEFIVQ